MKLSSLLVPAFAIALFTSAIVAPARAQHQPAAPQKSVPGGAMRDYPAPTNLKVLPENTTGKQIHEIMETWAGSLGVHCDTCHMADPKNMGPDGKPHLKFADDSKDDKKIARIMYTMTQQINADYISKAKKIDTDAEDMTVTCGTCHRGHKMPVTYVIPRTSAPGRGMPDMPGMHSSKAAPSATH